MATRAFEREPCARTQPAAAPSRGLRRRVAVAVAPVADRMIAATSLVSTDAVLNVRDFAWTAPLRDHSAAIREEAAALRGTDDAVPLWADGRPCHDILAHCPRTARLLDRLPGLHAAAVETLPAGAHRTRRRGLTGALVTCHLGLIVPRDGDARMRVGDRVVRWAAGETLMFDDARDHESWNDARTDRVILSLHVRRPLTRAGEWLAGLILGPARR